MGTERSRGIPEGLSRQFGDSGVLAGALGFWLLTTPSRTSLPPSLVIRTGRPDGVPGGGRTDRMWRASEKLWKADVEACPLAELSGCPGLAVLPKTLLQQLLPLRSPPRSPWGAAAQTHPIDILPWRLLPLSISALRSSPRPSSSVPTPAVPVPHPEMPDPHPKGDKLGWGVEHGSQSFHRVPAVAEGERHC